MSSISEVERAQDGNGEEQMTPSSARQRVPEADERVAHAGPETSVPAATAPLVVELGVQRRRRIEQLARGQGPLMTEVAEVIAEVRRQLAGELTGRTLVPLVIVYRQKRSRRRGGESKSPRSVEKSGYRVIFPR